MDFDPAVLGLLACICIMGIAFALDCWHRVK